MFKAVVLSFAATLFASPIFAQGENCGPTRDVMKYFHEKFGENITNSGVSPDNKFLFSWLENPTTHTFTILVSMADGTTCVIGGGKILEMG